MGFVDDIESKLKEIFNTGYATSDANVVPDKNSLTYGNTAKKLNATAFFIDIRKSRGFLEKETHITASKIHKCFLYLVSKTIREYTGELRSFSGDSVLAFFKGEVSDDNAIECAKKIKGIIIDIFNPLLKEKNCDELDFGIGIARGNITVVKGGIQGNEMYQDLIWLGWPTYVAYEFGNAVKRPKNICISNAVYEAIEDDAIKFDKDNNHWEQKDMPTSDGKRKAYVTNKYYNAR